MPEAEFDTIVVGAGLAGACAALFLSRSERVLVLEADSPGAGATGASAGLINPLMGRKAKPVSEIDTSLEAIHQLLDLAGAPDLFQGEGVLRPARNEEQASTFQEAALAHPGHATWLACEDVGEQFPEVRSPFGALLVEKGGWVDPARFIHTLLASVEQNGGVIRIHTPVEDWGEHDRRAYVVLEDFQERLFANRIVLALGVGALSFHALSPLHLRGVKGQTVRVRRPEGLSRLPPLSGSGYVVPHADHLVLGSSYEHEYDNLAPSDEQTRHILEKTTVMVPTLQDTEVIDASAGVRVYAGHHGRPYLGPAPGADRIWVFTGLGSRGLLTAPRLARAWAQEENPPTSAPSHKNVT